MLCFINIERGEKGKGVEGRGGKKENEKIIKKGKKNKKVT